MTRFTDSVGAMLLLDELDVAVIIIARDDESIRYANRRVCKDLGLGRKEIQGRCYRNVFWPEFLPVFDRLLARCELGGKHKTIYYWAEMMMWEQISARLIVWNGAPSILINIANISDVARSEFKFENIAYFDNLLKLPNGAKLEEDINELASLETVALLYFEIERFDDINNLYGWDNGDALLKQIRDWMLYSETRRSRLYRVNNGFALLGRKVTLDDACDRAREIKRRFAKSWALTAGGNSLQLYCTINLGVVYGKYVKNEMRNLLLRTIRTRRNAKVGYSVYDERADQEAKRVLILRDRLINSIFNDMKGFDIHYQPIVSAGARQWVAIEALCRWRDADGNNVPPLEFIPVAEQLGLVDHIDRWVRNSAMRLCAELGLVKRGFMLDVNFSPTQKIDDEFIKGLFQSMEKTGFPARKLNIEITESAKMPFDEQTIARLNLIKENDITLSLDDFGTGYSSFENLIKISADMLKTERLFLDKIENDPYRQYLLRVLADLAHFLDMRLVAEGVETETQYELLKDYGADYMQGYLFSKPLTSDELRAHVERFPPG